MKKKIEIVSIEARCRYMKSEALAVAANRVCGSSPILQMD